MRRATRTREHLLDGVWLMLSTLASILPYNFNDVVILALSLLHLPLIPLQFIDTEHQALLLVRSIVIPCE